MPRTTLPAVATLASLLTAHTALAQCIPSFNDGPDLPLPNASALALVDCNLDGLLDIIAGRNAANGALSIFRGLGNAQFVPRQDFGSMAQARHILLADFNNDNFPDFVVATDSGLESFRNLGGNPAFQQQVGPGMALRQLAAADMNNDGMLDIVAACATPPQVVIFTNDGTEGFFIQQWPLTSPATGIYLTDFTSDDRPDVIIGLAGTAGLFSFQNDGAGNLINGNFILSGAGGFCLAAGDLNADGLADLVNLSNSLARVNVFAADGSPGDFTLGAPLPVSSVSSFSLPAIVDVTGDSVPEIIAPNSNRLSFFQSTGPFTYGPAITHTTGSGQASQVAAGHVNDDGAIDLVVTNGSGTIRTLINTGGGNIFLHPQPQTAEFGGTATFSMAVQSNTPNTTLQWRRNGQPLAEGGHYAGVNTPMLTITAATEIEAGSYDCVVMSCAQLITSSATLTVSGCPSSDFNRDGDFGTDADIEAFFRVLAGGGC